MTSGSVVMVPSDRAIPRAVTEGQTIVEADPRGQAARVFQELAAIVSRDRVATTAAAPVDAESKTRRRLPLLRKET